jgi:tetratricopeptide (TPR) repeat protein
LQDWLLPVVYQQRPLDLSFATHRTETKKTSILPEEFRRENNPYGFIGRDGALLALERAMHRAPAGILIQGMGGIGKTTLVRGFVRWLEDTNGLGQGAFWLDFREIRSAEYVLNHIGEPLFGSTFGSAPLETKLEVLVQALKQHRFVIVWDNFESAAGIEGTSVTPNLSEKDRDLLARFLDGLRSGATKVLITSRSEEDWLGPQRRWKFGLSGLDGEERWEYCETILRDLGLTVNREDKAYAELMKQLGGHPLAMRVMLPELEKRSAAEIGDALRGNLEELNRSSGDAAYAQLFSALRFIEQALPESLRPLLEPLSFHEAYVDLDYLEDMAKGTPGGWSRPQIDRLAAMLSNAGLLRGLGQAIYELHPVLTGYLRTRFRGTGSDEWKRRFVDVMGTVAHSLTSRQLHEQRVPFYLHGANFHWALVEAVRLEMTLDERALTQSLAAWALNNRDFSEAERLYLTLARHPESVAGAYHQLGMVTQERRDFEAAEQWYRKSLAISERQGNERGSAGTYHQLGLVAQERRDFEGAEQWYRKALAISEKQGDEHGAALTYHQLGRVADERRDFEAAEQWYLKSLTIEEKQGDEHGAALTYHQLGVVAQHQRDFEAAERWYRKSLAIKEKHGNEHGAANTYHQLGVVAQHQRDFQAAEQWYLKSLAIEEKQGNEHGAAVTYHQLGLVAQERRDFQAAERWYRKSLAIEEKQGDEHGAAITYHQLAQLAAAQQKFMQAGRLSLRAIAGFIRKDDYTARIAVNGFIKIHTAASTDEKRELEALWVQAGLGEFPPKENS